MAVLKMLTALVVLAFATRAAAHGGVLHEWPSTPTGSNYLRTKVASCSNWVPTKGRVAYSLVNSTAAAVNTAPVFRGDVTVWQYLYKNCSLTAEEAPSAGVEFNVTVTQDGRPVGGLTLDGVAMTGSCASSRGSPYYFNTSLVPIDDEDNILWFHNFTTNVTGRIHGNGANDGNVKTAGERSLKSVRIVNTNTQESLACCDLTIAGQPNTDWAATLQGKGKQCADEGHGSAAAKAAEASDPHAGHNMSDPNHDHDHSMMSMTTGANASARASSAAAPAVAAAGKLVAVMTVVISVMFAVV